MIPYSTRFLSALSVATAACIFFAAPVHAQNSDKGFDLSVHAHDTTSLVDIGLPGYPGAVPAHDSKDDSASADLGFSFGDYHFKMLVASFETSDSPAQVLAFYRKPLAKYGDVLECEHGKPVGPPAIARSGLTCSDKEDGSTKGNTSGNISSDGRELRAGTPRHFRIVGIDTTTHPGRTKFGLVYLELPKDSDGDSK